MTDVPTQCSWRESDFGRAFDLKNIDTQKQTWVFAIMQTNNIGKCNNRMLYWQYVHINKKRVWTLNQQSLGTISPGCVTSRIAPKNHMICFLFFLLIYSCKNVCNCMSCVKPGQKKNKIIIIIIIITTITTYYSCITVSQCFTIIIVIQYSRSITQTTILSLKKC